MKRAKGEFEVKLVPLIDERTIRQFGRMSIDKTFHGDLEGTSQGYMLAARTETPNSAGYVAIELVTGTLHGLKGSFFLQHSGRMDRGAQSLLVAVVPDSGTDELIGLAGTLAITITDGKHHYEVEYSLPDKK